MAPERDPDSEQPLVAPRDSAPVEPGSAREVDPPATSPESPEGAEVFDREEAADERPLPAERPAEREEPEEQPEERYVTQREPEPQHTFAQGMLPTRTRQRSKVERLLVRLIATFGIIAIGVAIGAIMTSSNSQGWVIGLVVAGVTVILSALLWSSAVL